MSCENFSFYKCVYLWSHFRTSSCLINYKLEIRWKSSRTKLPHFFMRGLTCDKLKSLFIINKKSSVILTSFT
jgi:hypothetical protein